VSSNQQLLLGEGAGSAPAVFIEDVFSTYLYTGTGSTQTITNGIDLAGEGGAVWIKNRATVDDNVLFNTLSGPTKMQRVNTTDAQETVGTDVFQAFNSDGFRHGGWGGVGGNGDAIVSWTFRKQPKFFDVVTGTCDGSGNITVNHLLGSVPGFVTIKRTDGVSAWAAYHTSLGNNQYFYLNATNAAATLTNVWGATSTTFTANFGFAAGAQVVLYLFAHDAGGFGLAGTDNVISCGSFTTDGSGNATVNLGYEPQWLMTKVTSTTGGWRIFDTMRGWSSGIDALLVPNNSGAEYFAEDYGTPTATGMNITNHGASLTWIYIAIRRGPMKVPTVGTSVFIPVTRAGTGAATTVTGAAFPPDFLFNIDRFGTGPAARYNYDRLRGAGQTDLRTNSTAAEGSAGAIGVSSFDMGGFSIASTGVSFLNDGAASYINYLFRRAPSFMDVVCYTGTGANTTQTHNLGASPQLVIVKARSDAGTNWLVYPSTTSFGNALYLNTTTAFIGSGPVSALSSTTVTFYYYGNPAYSASTSAVTYVAYLFATCAGVSKVGSYTGNGSSQTIACGFTAGSRFVLIKRTDSTGDWYVWDSARGIIAGNDPHLSLNDTAAEVTTDDSVDTDNSGFIVNQDAATNVNVSSATYIFLAIA